MAESKISILTRDFGKMSVDVAGIKTALAGFNGKKGALNELKTAQKNIKENTEWRLKTIGALKMLKLILIFLTGSWALTFLTVALRMLNIIHI